MKILIMGLPGSGVRTQYDDWDFTPEGRQRQTLRMLHLSQGVELAGKVAVVDFVCPTNKLRKLFNADYTVWMDTIKESRFEDTNQMFETPDDVDYHVSAWFKDTHKQLVKIVSTYMARNS
jgi:adenylylsulfate kinase